MLCFGETYHSLWLFFFAITLASWFNQQRCCVQDQLGILWEFVFDILLFVGSRCTSCCGEIVLNYVVFFNLKLFTFCLNSCQLVQITHILLWCLNPVYKDNMCDICSTSLLHTSQWSYSSPTEFITQLTEWIFIFKRVNTEEVSVSSFEARFLPVLSWRV